MRPRPPWVPRTLSGLCEHLSVDLIDVLRILFYIWLFGALGVWIYRGYRRFVRGRTDDLAERATVGSGTAKDERPKRRTETGMAPGRRTMRQVLDDQQAAKTPDAPIPEGGLVSSVLKEEIAARKQRDAAGQDRDPEGTAPAPAAGAAADPGAAKPTGSERRGLFAPVADDEPAEPPAVSTLLDGMDMPCDLVPLITTDLMPSPSHVVFVTTGHLPATVGAAIGDELERLGFALRSESDTEVRATRDGDQLRVTLYEDAKAAELDGTPRFPSVPGGSVAVEFRS